MIGVEVGICFRCSARVDSTEGAHCLYAPRMDAPLVAAASIYRFADRIRERSSRREGGWDGAPSCGTY